MRAIICFLALLLSACATAQVSTANNAASAPQASTETSPTPPVISDPENPDRSCKVDADCEVKNVGNCCGAHPECVNKDALTDPAKVKAMCGQEHRMSTCNIRAIGGCSCSQGQCQDLNPAALRKIP